MNAAGAPRSHGGELYFRDILRNITPVHLSLRNVLYSIFLLSFRSLFFIYYTCSQGYLTYDIEITYKSYNLFSTRMKLLSGMVFVVEIRQFISDLPSLANIISHSTLMKTTF